MAEAPKAESGSSPTAEIRLIDLRQQYRALQPKVHAALRRVFDSGVFVSGPNVRAFEEEMADFCGVAHAVGVDSGTDALTLSLAALGIKRGDDVLVPSFTYAATAAAVCHLGARPVFVDSLPDGFNLDPGDAEQRLTERTRAIVPVHLYGEAAPMDEILELARRHGLSVVEDVAQAAGGRWNGKMLGSLGHTGCFSFYPTKNLGGCGDGGMITTDDDQLAERVRLLRQQADAAVLGGRKYTHLTVGYNSRLDEIQAAILRVKLPHLESWNRLRASHAEQYRKRFQDSTLRSPAASRDGSHVYFAFTVRHSQREALRSHLRAHRIATEIWYPLPLHLQEAYRGLGYAEGDLPISEALSREALSLPVYPELTPEQIDRVANAALESVGAHAETGAEETVGHEL